MIELEGVERTYRTGPDAATTSWIRTTSPDQAFVDRTTAEPEDRLAALGYETWGEITYVAVRDEVAANRTVRGRSRCSTSSSSP